MKVHCIIRVEIIVAKGDIAQHGFQNSSTADALECIYIHKWERVNIELLRRNGHKSPLANSFKIERNLFQLC